MSTQNTPHAARRQQQTFLACLRQWLTPALFKQVHQVAPRRDAPRWPLHPLLMILFAMTWCAGDSQPERFAMARAFYVASAPKRKRPGATLPGFHKALAALPTLVLRTLATALRLHLLLRFGLLLETDGWKVFGCDGTRLRCPQVAELEQRLGNAGGDPEQAMVVPQVWLTALVHLGSGLLWSWQVGKGNASEREHLARLIPTLPKNALLVADAGYQGYDLARTLLQAPVSFLIRVSSQTMFYTPDALEVAAVDWSDGLVYYWPSEAQKKQQPPLAVRLLCVRDARCKHPVWLASNVLSAERLSLEAAGRFYRMRWENEGFFRSYKRTLGKVKLHSRSVALVHREVLGSLLGMQLLLAQGAAALLLLSHKRAKSSVRELLCQTRREIQDLLRGKVRGGFWMRLLKAVRQHRERSSSKQKRPWPGRKDAKPIKPPRIRKLTDDEKVLFDQCLQLD